jgi:PAS domain-containing protein
MKNDNPTIGELEKHASVLNTIIQGTTDAGYIKDLKGKYLFLNRAAVEITGKKTVDVFEDYMVKPIKEEVLLHELEKFVNIKHEQNE